MFSFSGPYYEALVIYSFVSDTTIHMEKYWKTILILLENMDWIIATDENHTEKSMLHAESPFTLQLDELTGIFKSDFFRCNKYSKIYEDYVKKLLIQTLFHFMAEVDSMAVEFMEDDYKQSDDYGVYKKTRPEKLDADLNHLYFTMKMAIEISGVKWYDGANITESPDWSSGRKKGSIRFR